MATGIIPGHARGSRSDHAELSLRIRSAGLLERRTAYYVATFTLTSSPSAPRGWLSC
jgi:hypothetical protein